MPDFVVLTISRKIENRGLTEPVKRFSEYKVMASKFTAPIPGFVL